MNALIESPEVAPDGGDASSPSADAYWDELITVALLGTDRRRPPVPPAGPVADVVTDLDLVRGDSSDDARLLNHVATMALARRLAARPGPPATPLAPPPPDDRPWCPVAAVASWRTLVDDWPLLEDEWLARAIATGVRPSGDLLMDLLERHRVDVRRRQLVQHLAGSIVGWTSEHLGLAMAPAGPPLHQLVALPAIPLHPDVAIDLAGAAPAQFANAVVDVLAADAFSGADRRLLEHVLARCAPSALSDVERQLSRVADDARGAAAAAVLAELARTRTAMLDSFGTSS